MAERLLSDVLEMQAEEEPLVPIEVDPVLLMSDKQIKKEVEQMPPTQRALFDDLRKNLQKIERQILVPVNH